MESSHLVKITGTTVETIIDNDPPPVYNPPGGIVPGGSTPYAPGSGSPVGTSTSPNTNPSPPGGGSNGGGNNSSDGDIITLEDFIETFPEDASGGQIPPGTTIVYPPGD